MPTDNTPTGATGEQGSQEPKQDEIKVNIDPDKPTTILQIRLLDGTRLVCPSDSLMAWGRCRLQTAWWLHNWCSLYIFYGSICFRLVHDNRSIVGDRSLLVSLACWSAGDCSNCFSLVEQIIFQQIQNVDDRSWVIKLNRAVKVNTIQVVWVG